MGKIKSSVGLNQDKIQSTGLSSEIRKAAVVIVVPNTLQSDALLMAKSAFIVKRKITFQPCVIFINIAKAVVAIEISLKTTDSVEKTNMR